MPNFHMKYVTMYVGCKKVSRSNDEATVASPSNLTHSMSDRHGVECRKVFDRSLSSGSVVVSIPNVRLCPVQYEHLR